MELNPDQHRLGGNTLASIYANNIELVLFEGISRSASPMAIVFGGQPGAGKSAAVLSAVDSLKEQGGAVRIVGDELRSYLPNYDDLMRQDDKTAAFFTNRDAASLVEMAIDSAKNKGVNFVIEGTMRDPNVVSRTIGDLKEANYIVQARVVAVNYRLSQAGILERYEVQKNTRGYGRMTPDDWHQVAYAGLSQSVARIEHEKIADSLFLVDRNLQTVYRNDLVDGQWVKPARAQEALDTERNRPLTGRELQGLVQDLTRVNTLLGNPERHAGPREITLAKDLLAGAQADLTNTIKTSLSQAQSVAQSLSLQVVGKNDIQRGMRGTVRATTLAHAVVGIGDSRAVLIETHRLPGALSTGQSLQLDASRENARAAVPTADQTQSQIQLGR